MKSEILELCIYDACNRFANKQGEEETCSFSSSVFLVKLPKIALLILSKKDQFSRNYCFNMFTETLPVKRS